MNARSYPQIIALLGALAGLTPLAIDMYLPAIPTLARDMGVSIELAQYSISCYLAGFAIGQLLFGPMTDSLGRLPVLTAGLVIFALASLGCAYAGGIEWLLLCRALQAVGGAAGSVVVMAMLRDLFQRDQFARAMSFVMLVMNLAPLVAPVLGGYLLLVTGWPAIFLVLCGVALLLAVAIVRWIGETLPRDQRPPLALGQALANYRDILANRACMALLVQGALTSMALFAFITGSPYVYIEHFEVAPENFGYLFGLNIVTMMTLTSFNARYVARYGAPRMLAIGLGIQALGATLLLLLTGLGNLWGLVVPVMLIMGPMGMVSANAMALCLDTVAGQAGSVVALGGFMRFTGGALVGGVLGWFHSDSPWALVLAMALSVLAAATLYFTVNRGSMAAQE